MELLQRTLHLGLQDPKLRSTGPYIFTEVNSFTKKRGDMRTELTGSMEQIPYLEVNISRDSQGILSIIRKVPCDVRH